jgi:thiol-disulfide isomerase/thioredoxin
MPRLILAGLAVAPVIAAALALAVVPLVRPRADGLVAAAFAPSSALPDPERSLFGATQWLNTPPLRPEDLRGKVVLVNFWTYSCINSLRALPYVRVWAEKYKGRGLVVVGVHAPEFGFEKVLANVRQATAALGVSYPVVLDSDYRIWRAFDNQAWPALYFIGAHGRVRRRVLGEGNYDQSELLIQQLLSQANGARVASTISAVTGGGPEAPADEPDERSGETYIGYAKASNFASPGGMSEDTPTLYRAASELPLNQWSLAGVWAVGREFATLNNAPGAIRIRFRARDLHLVLAASSLGPPIRFRVTIDGAAPGANHGSDVDAAGLGSVQAPRLYQLVRQQGPVSDRTFEIQFLNAGVRAYVFTFG